MTARTTSCAWVVRAVLCALGALPLAGCSPTLDCVPVSGTITLGGQPLAGDYRIVFTPDAAKGNTVRAACSAPLEEGRYELFSIGMTSSEHGAGAPPGWYKVSLQSIGSSKPGKGPASQTASINRMYLSPEKTPLEVEVKPNAPPGSYDLKLNR